MQSPKLCKGIAQSSQNRLQDRVPDIHKNRRCVTNCGLDLVENGCAPCIPEFDNAVPNVIPNILDDLHGRGNRILPNHVKHGLDIFKKHISNTQNLRCNVSKQRENINRPLCQRGENYDVPNVGKHHCCRDQKPSDNIPSRKNKLVQEVHKLIVEPFI